MADYRRCVWTEISQSYGPTIEEFQRLLFNTNRRIRGFEIVQARA